MNEQLRGLLTGLGAMAELTKASFDAFLRAGFNREQAIYLAGELMKESLRMSGDKHREDD